MRHGIFLANRVKPSGWAHATRLTHAPRRNLLRQCALQSWISGQSRWLQSNSTSDEIHRSAQDDLVSENDRTSRSSIENGESTKLNAVNERHPVKPAKDHNWLWKYTGDRIDTINGKALKGTEEYVSHSSGTKLLCSWTVAPGNERAIWVPGDAPRVRDMKIPVDLKPEAILSQRNSDWTLGNPETSFEPFFASLSSMNPLANFDSTDVIARSGSLYQLLGVVRGNLRPLGISSAIAFHMTLVKNTLLIKRIQYSDTTLGRGLTPTLTGSFMNKITEMRAPDDEMPPDHYHAVRYDLAHLRCVTITPVDAATGNASLPPLSIPDNAPKLSQASESVKVMISGRGVPPGAVTKLMTGFMSPDASRRRVNYKGQLRIKPAGQSRLWFDRPKTILQGHLEPAQPGAPEDAARLTRVSLREAGPILDQMEDACQLELRKLVALLDRLRNIARRVGGSCILTCLPPEKDESGGIKVTAKFDVYKCGPEVEPLVLDWHVKQFWSKK
ncbi:hypothetical protein N0V93_007625 [Gnomoniopsis smithogilvyi]|uniref:Uncharacterized protein n=1 Tax=Gnomoniopsis smithogilvyi TaxID=1191159 RepID=A0A9W8YRY9_9PEZI|nr:hypothetical protein N0V93_007625 [Gnomoniopsis smithogilvyi]